MPIYEYQCDKCGHHLEALQRLADKPLRECPECGRHSLKRLMSAPLFRLAGSGWYETDFKSDKEQKRNLVEKSEKGDAAPAAVESKPAVETATKPDAKAESKPAAGVDGSSRRPGPRRTTARAPAKAPSRRKEPVRARKR